MIEYPVPVTESLLQEITNRIVAAFDPERVILFGSYARGDFMYDSDIDIVLLLDNLTNVIAEREKYIPIISRISLEYDTVVSIVPFDFEEFHQKRTPLILNVNKEGIRI